MTSELRDKEIGFRLLSEESTRRGTYGRGWSLPTFWNQVKAVDREILLVGYRTVTGLTHRLSCDLFMPPLQRRIEDRIRELCTKAVAAADGDREPALEELSQLLHGTIEHMRKRATSLLVERKRLLEPRRRENDNEVV